MYHFLIIIQAIICVSMIIIILLQRSSADGIGGMGGGSGGGGGLISTRAQANLMTRTTAILAALFIVNSLVLSKLSQRDDMTDSIADRVIESKTVAPEVPLPADGTPAEGAITEEKIQETAPEVSKKTPEVPQPKE